VSSSRNILDRILQTIAPLQRVCIVGHLRPDGDCIGSQFALALALKAQGKKVECWNQDPVPAKFSFLAPKGLMRQPRKTKPFDAVIAVDCASAQRLGTASQAILPNTPVINIDHHASNTQYGHLNWVSAHEPSTGELIHQLIQHANWPITPAIANNLYTAISTDTGSFQYPTTLPSTLKTAADLVQHGANLEIIAQEVYQSFPLARVELLREVYKRFQLHHENQTASFYLRQADYTRTGASTDDSEGLIDHLRCIQPVIVACLFEEAGRHLTRISLRSKDTRLDVNQIASQFGGGGHRAAAGARIAGPPKATQQAVLNAIQIALKRLQNQPAKRKRHASTKG
jgi:phosphoesterase RecJ-like protein